MFEKVFTRRPEGFKISEGTGKWQLVSEIIQQEFIFVQLTATLQYCAAPRKVFRQWGMDVYV